MGSCYKQVQNYIGAVSDGIVLEIGSDRHEGSSSYFADIAKQLNTKFITLDLDEHMSQHLSYRIPGYLKQHTRFIHCDGTEWTKTCKHQISVLYLDNFDWDWEVGTQDKMIKDQRAWYQERGIEMNNVNCQVAHLTQMQNLLTHMTDNCIVCLDDTYLHNGVYIGKGGAVVPYLLVNGFEILLTQDYGVIMGRTK